MRHLRFSSLGLGLLITGCFTPVSDSPQDTVNASLAAAHDNLAVTTTDGCGRIELVNFAPGASVTNHNYLVVHNLCGDSHSIKAWAWLNGAPLGSKSLGLTTAPTIWAPFPSRTLSPGDAIGLKVCLSDGAPTSAFSRCGSLTRASS